LLLPFAKHKVVHSEIVALEPRLVEKPFMALSSESSTKQPR